MPEAALIYFSREPVPTSLEKALDLVRRAIDRPASCITKNDQQCRGSHHFMRIAPEAGRTG